MNANQPSYRRATVSGSFLASLFCVIAVALLPGCNKNPITSVVETFTPTSPNEAVQMTFNPFDADQRRKGLSLLASSDFGGDELYVRTYRTLLTDQDATVRAAAIQALGLHGESEDALLLVNSLEDNSDTVRWEAAKALQKLHHKDAVLPLSKRMRAENEEAADVRQACAAALGQYATVYSFEALVNVLNDNDFGVVSAARDSLATMTGQTLGTNPATWVAWAADNKGQLFANGREYTWKPFETRPSFIQRMQFWKDREKPQPRKPAGYEAQDAGDAQSKK